MGMAKEMLMEYEARGYVSSDSQVCCKCVGNDQLKQFIIDNGSDGEICDFCKNEGVCVGLEELCGEVMNGVTNEYERAVESMFYDGREGGYHGAITWDTRDLLEELNDDMKIENSVLEEIIDMFYDKTWCKCDPYGLRLSEKQTYMWQRFSEMVKFRTRYVFFRKPKRDKYDETDSSILDFIGQAVSKLGLIRPIPTGSLFYRGRTHKKNESLQDVAELCSPPKEHAKPNRMSAEGISVFYCANDIETVLTEIDDGESAATVVAFENTRTLHILDLFDTSKYAVPSLFDDERRHLREAAIFLKSFNSDLTREITEMSAIEYIPAQVVAEYFRYLYTFNGSPIDGISYSSSKHKNGVCYVLFFSHSQFKRENNCALKMLTPKYFDKKFSLGD